MKRLTIILLFIFLLAAVTATGGQRLFNILSDTLDDIPDGTTYKLLTAAKDTILDNTSNTNTGDVVYTGTANEIDLTGTAFGIVSNPIIPGNEKMRLPAGTTGTRPGSPVYGDMRFNSSTDQLEFYLAAWAQVVDSADIGVSVEAADAAIVKSDEAETITSDWAFSGSIDAEEINDTHYFSQYYTAGGAAQTATDLGTALTAASGKTLIIDGGSATSYIFTGVVTVPANTIVKSDGAWLKWDMTAQTGLSLHATGGQTLQNLYLDVSNTSENTNYAISYGIGPDGPNVKILNVHIEGVDSAAAAELTQWSIKLDGSKDNSYLQIKDCTFKQVAWGIARFNGVWNGGGVRPSPMGNISFAQITGNTFEDVLFDAYDTNLGEDDEGMLISGNTFNGIGGIGIGIAGAGTQDTNAFITVVDYTGLGTDTVVINGSGITETTLTEGTEWTAATSNDATATSLASAIDALGGVSATATLAVVTVNPDDEISALTTSGGADLTIKLPFRPYQITVVDWSALDSANTFTINGTTRTETTDWVAATSETVTATNIAADINANVTGFAAVSTGAEVSILPEPGYVVAYLSTNAAAAEMTATINVQRQFVISNNIIKDTYLEAIHIEHCPIGYLITGNNIYDCGTAGNDGIVVWDAGGEFQITNNNVYRSGANGIRTIEYTAAGEMEHAANYAIKNNMVVDSVGYGIHAESNGASTNVDIVANTIIRPGTSGIYIQTGKADWNVTANTVNSATEYSYLIDCESETGNVILSSNMSRGAVFGHIAVNNGKNKKVYDAMSNLWNNQTTISHVAAMWSFADTTDESNNGNTLTGDNTPTAAFGPNGGPAIDYELGTKESHHASDSASLSITGDLTISLFIKAESLGANSYPITKLGANPQKSYALYLTTGGAMYAYITANGTNLVSCNTSNAEIVVGEWQHWVFVYDGVKLQLYKNGQQSGSATAHSTGIHDGTTDLYIGAGGFENNNYDGKMAKLRIYNKALNMGEIQEMTRNGIGY